MAESGIYEIVNLVNGKRYVGSAVNFAKRWRAHRLHLRRGTHHSRHLQASWKRHGEDVFAFRVVRYCGADVLIEQEQIELDAGNCAYNVCPTAGSTLGRKFTSETKAKIAAKAKGRKMPPRDESYRAKMSAAHKGRQKTPEHMAALQAGRRAKVWTDADKAARSEGTKLAYAEGRKSRERSPEYREKIAATLRERSQDPKVRDQLSIQAAEAWAARPAEDRKRHMAMVRAARGEMTQEQRQAISDRQRGKPMKPHVAAALLAANKGRKHAPEVVAVRTARLREWWTPERKEQRAAAMREHHARRRAALGQE